MKKFLFYFVLISFFTQVIYCDILYSEPKFDEYVQILVEGAGNSSALLISPSGVRRNTELISGQGKFLANEHGVWIVEFGGQSEKIGIKSRGVEFAGRKIERMNYFDFIKWGAILAGLFVVFAVMAAVALAYFKGAWRTEPSLNMYEENDKSKIIFYTSGTKVENLEIICDGEILVRRDVVERGKKIDVGFEKKPKDVSAVFLVEGERRTIFVKEIEDGMQTKQENAGVEKKKLRKL